MEPDSTAPPLPNSYWVETGRLLAGEHPGGIVRAEAMERLRTLLRAGVASFIDLTEKGELPEYDHLLPQLTEQPIRYRRLPIVDHGLPESPAHMGQVVDAIEEELKAGRCVYAHCRAGIGRTGMAIACYLIRSGLTNDAALERLQILWRQSARSRRWPSVPETDAQVEFVNQWRDAARACGGPLAMSARYEGALIGLALGDALGSLVASAAFHGSTLSERTHELHTSVHTATTRALAESLLLRGSHDPADQMRRYLHWTRAVGHAAVPSELRRALAAWQWSNKPNAGSHDPKKLDSHSLPRTLAVALVLRADPQRAIDAAADASRTTQQAPMVLDLCRVWAGQFIDALEARPKRELLAYGGPALQFVRQRALKPQIKALLEGRLDAQAEGLAEALAATAAAMSSFAETETFRDALVNLAAAKRAPVSAAALCGALSGAYYGVEAIPLDWRKRIGEEAVLRSLAQRLLT